MDSNLLCNNRRCRVPLTSEAWLTRCSHIFCSAHFPTERKCPCCSTDLSGRNDIFRRNLNPPDSFRTVVLAGLNPKDIIEAGFKALEFLNFQSFHERMFWSSYIKHQRLKLAQSEIKLSKTEESYETAINKLKELIQKEANECENLQREVDVLRREKNAIENRNQILEEKVYVKNKQLHKLFAKFENLRRQPSQQGERIKQSSFSQRVDSRNHIRITSNDHNMFCSQQNSTVPSSMEDHFFSSSQPLRDNRRARFI